MDDEEQRAERGLSGTSGFVGGGRHINGPYGAADDEVFAVIDNEGMPAWERVKLSDLNDRAFIGCHFCIKPAKMVDHSWPYMVGGTRCDEHKNEPMPDE